ncbi:MAG: hypothetical protein AAF741_07300 [Bacteroidota bacterium]
MKTFLFTLLFCGLTFGALAAAPDGPQGIFDRLATENGVSELRIAIDYDLLEANRRTEDYMPATLNDGDQSYELKVRVRGRFRRTQCAMPPLKIKFNKSQLLEQGLNRHNDFKLVTHCVAGDAGQDYLLREQLAYELYRTIAGEAAFRTELFKVTYVNTVDGSTETSYAILIEDTDDLEDRLSAKKPESLYGNSYTSFDNAEMVSLFQYMIGNLDYSLAQGRNVKLMQKDNGQITAVPYDFDFAGMVGTDYTRLRVDLGQRWAGERVWIWEFDQSAELDAATDTYLALENQLMQQVEDFDLLSAGSRNEIKSYLKNFYRDLKRGRVTK